MKSLLATLLLFAAASVASADLVRELSCDAMAEKSDAIAIVTVGSSQDGKFVGEGAYPPNAKPGRRRYSRKTAAQVEKIVKGELPDDLAIYDTSGHWDVLFQEGAGRYLVFLRGKPDFLTGTNGWLSSRSIKDGSVLWADAPGQKLKSVPISDLIARIQSATPEQSAASDAVKLRFPEATISALQGMTNGRIFPVQENPATRITVPWLDAHRKDAKPLSPEALKQLGQILLNPVNHYEGLYCVGDPTESAVAFTYGNKTGYIILRTSLIGIVWNGTGGEALLNDIGTKALDAWKRDNVQQNARASSPRPSPQPRGSR